MNEFMKQKEREEGWEEVGGRGGVYPPNNRDAVATTIRNLLTSGCQQESPPRLLIQPQEAMKEARKRGREGGRKEGRERSRIKNPFEPT